MFASCLLPETVISQAIIIIICNCLFKRSHTCLTCNGHIIPQITPQSSITLGIIFTYNESGIHKLTFVWQL
jgi:hypothetical protein